MRTRKNFKHGVIVGIFAAVTFLAAIGASRLPGYRVTDTVVPMFDTDTYPTHEAKYGKGGFRTVATTNDRDSILTTYREAGMMVFVTNQSKTYQLGQDLLTWSEFTGASTGAVTSWNSRTGAVTPATNDYTAAQVYAVFTPTNYTAATERILDHLLGIDVALGSAGAGFSDSAGLRGILSDETGTGAAVFAGGDIGAATATTASSADSSTKVATTAFVAGEIATHTSDTTSVHGIADTSLLLDTSSTIDDDKVAFDDTDNLWTATTIGEAIEELNDSINAGSPNGSGAKVHWSQLLGVPAGFADGTDDGGSGSSITVDGSSATNLNSGPFVKLKRTGEEVEFVSPDAVTASGTSATPDFSASDFFEYTLTGNFTLNAASNVSSNFNGKVFKVRLIQDGTGSRLLTLATNWETSGIVSGVTLTTNASYSDEILVQVLDGTRTVMVGFVPGIKP